MTNEPGTRFHIIPKEKQGSKEEKKARNNRNNIKEHSFRKVDHHCL